MTDEDYVGLHKRYAQLMDAGHLECALSEEDAAKIRHRLSRLFDRMMKVLFRQQGAEMKVEIMLEKPVQDFMEAHATALDQSMKEVAMSELMRRRLQESNYVFSGMKTFHELREAFPSLLDENGVRKTFERFLNDVRKVDETYNSHYLRAEYNFVHASASMAGKWEQFMEDGDRYNLQYRTVGDGKVRPTHAALHNVTLPPSDPFWDEYYPPNGWNCRCTVVQVIKGKYPETPHDEAMRLGELALQDDRKGMFRFNPGKRGKSVPDYNPYTISRCRDCDIAKGNLKLAFVPDNELCEACELLHRCVGQAGKSERAIERRHYIDKEMAPLLKKVVTKTVKDGRRINIRFSKDGNAHLYSDVLGRTDRVKLDDLKNMDSILDNATYFDEAVRVARHSNPYEYFYYFKTMLNGQAIRLNVGKRSYTAKNGKTYVEYICYSVNSIK